MLNKMTIDIPLTHVVLNFKDKNITNDFYYWWIISGSNEFIKFLESKKTEKLDINEIKKFVKESDIVSMLEGVSEEDLKELRSELRKAPKIEE